MRISSAVLLAVIIVSFAGHETNEHRACVSHVETLAYPKLAQTAHITGEAVVRVTINEAGKVEKAEAISGPPILLKYAVANVGGWTFSPPESAPQTETITFQFEIGDTPETKFTADLPHRVEILAPPVELQSQQSR